MIRTVGSTIAVSVFLWCFAAGGRGQSQQAYKMLQLFEWVGNHYVDTVNLSRLSERMIRKTLQELDPHSVYVSRDEVRTMNERLEGSFEGIGMSCDWLNDTALVVSTVSGGPAEKTGIRRGDRIVVIDGDTVAGKNLKMEHIIKRIRGKKGTKVRLAIFRKGGGELLQFTVTRDRIPDFSVNAAYRVSGKTGYIRLNRFAASSHREFTEALQKLRKEGVVDIILDLTGNGGGYVDMAVQLADEFFDKGRLIVYTEGRNSGRVNYTSLAGGDFRKGKLVVMINENSASASEIFAGAIQDWDRGMIVGRRSFGKGLVQRQMLFADSSALRLTIARYHTPTGRVIQKPYGDGGEYEKEIRNRLQSGELTGETAVKINDSLQFKTLVKGRTVYGGGGIIPDVFVPLDTSYYTDYYKKLLERNILEWFILEYVDKNRSALERKYPDFSKFERDFRVSDAMPDDLRRFALQKGIDGKPEEAERSRERLQVRMKAYIALCLWSDNEFYRIINRQEPIFLKALEVIADLQQNR
ncbi:MAG: PDZ domain-containing protein [Bacteroidales bacterium]|jgi:carboxyl-terminal processing protease|nr:PDZ domain-containing protein [Bacteroidales bacterium]